MLRKLVVERFQWIDGDADVPGLFRDGEILVEVGAGLVELFDDEAFDLVVAPEARGFVLGALVARVARCGLVLIRKPGSVHPGRVIEEECGLDWRGNRPRFRLREDDIEVGQRVLLVDDWVETGSQMTACVKLIERAGGVVVGVAALVRDCDEATADRLRLRSVVEVGEVCEE